MDTKIIRDLVKKHLSKKPRNTVEIKDWLSDNIQLEDNYDIAAILESDPTIIRIGRVMKVELLGKIILYRNGLPMNGYCIMKENSLELMEISKYENN